MARRSARSPAHGRRAALGRFTRLRALLAGALVLGVGGTVTLAAWTDTETARGSFAASVFGIEGSTDGTNYAEHPATGAAALDFTVAAGAMSPGTTVHSRFLVRTTSPTTVSGTAMLGGATVGGTGLGASLRYGASVIPAASACTAATFAQGTVIVPAGSALSAGASASQPLVAGGAAAVAYCFQVTLPAGTPNSVQGQTGTATWTITATSSS
ncbi:SipW-dependent-type signal peptide-containing protein [Leucobacter allii]|uniref:SipW-dependent-type signal peptide-containing protein n=1 Tax=Leucobacter allii TaxID=2932247 RepID=UPI001FD03948|nr:SipW-dependent-type signal peptide-containing protein [Leucobacter allii]UOR01076.1 SipW-dependent-type signal peptide-containing protein [Leucobacter allii]